MIGFRSVKRDFSEQAFKRYVFWNQLEMVSQFVQLHVKPSHSGSTCVLAIRKRSPVAAERAADFGALLVASMTCIAAENVQLSMRLIPESSRSLRNVLASVTI